MISLCLYVVVWLSCMGRRYNATGMASVLKEHVCLQRGIGVNVIHSCCCQPYSCIPSSFENQPLMSQISGHHFPKARGNCYTLPKFKLHVSACCHSVQSVVVGWCKHGHQYEWCSAGAEPFQNCFLMAVPWPLQISDKNMTLRYMQQQLRIASSLSWYPNVRKTSMIAWSCWHDSLKSCILVVIDMLCWTKRYQHWLIHVLDIHADTEIFGIRICACLLPDA